MKKKTVAEIDPTLKMEREDFLTLFEHLPLTEEEQKKVEDEYYPMYVTFLESGTEPITSWLATRNIFTVQQAQIAERQKGKIIGVAGSKED